MDHGNDHDMMMNPSSSMGHNNMSMQNHDMMMMHMTFYWGKNGEILFSGWPGTRTGMYILALVVFFLLSVLVEWLARSPLVKPSGTGWVSCVLRALLYSLRIGFGYILMLAVMSFNVGVFIVVIVGHALGYMVFESGNERSDDPNIHH